MILKNKLHADNIVNSLITRHLAHPFPPFFHADSQLLILGSFPSVKSVEVGFYYGHPTNRFYRVMGAILDEPLEYASWEVRKAILRHHHIALYDVIGECTIHGSSDATISEGVPSDLESLLQEAPIRRIVCNGKAAAQLYLRWFGHLPIPMTMLPSTSAANAQYSLDRLIHTWKIIQVYHPQEEDL